MVSDRKKEVWGGGWGVGWGSELVKKRWAVALFIKLPQSVLKTAENTF